MIFLPMVTLLCLLGETLNAEAYARAVTKHYGPSNLCGERVLAAGQNCSFNFLPSRAVLKVFDPSGNPRHVFVRNATHGTLSSKVLPVPCPDGSQRVRNSSHVPFMVLMQGPRVGSTWLTELLDSYPRVACRGEQFNEHPCSAKLLKEAKFAKLVRCILLQSKHRCFDFRLKLFSPCPNPFTSVLPLS